MKALKDPQFSKYCTFPQTHMNRTNMVKFDAHLTSGAKKGGFEISLATDLKLSFSPLKTLESLQAMKKETTMK